MIAIKCYICIVINNFKVSLRFSLWNRLIQHLCLFLENQFFCYQIQQVDAGEVSALSTKEVMPCNAQSSCGLIQIEATFTVANNPGITNSLTNLQNLALADSR